MSFYYLESQTKIKNKSIFHRHDASPPGTGLHRAKFAKKDKTKRRFLYFFPIFLSSVVLGDLGVLAVK
jgi:hypothetical protein